MILKSRFVIFLISIIFFKGFLCSFSIAQPTKIATKEIGTQEIISLLKEALQSRISLSGDFDLHLSNPRLTVNRSNEGDQLTIHITSVDEQRLTFKGEGHLISSANSDTINILPLEGKILPLTDIPVLTRAFTPGEEIAETDLTWQKIPSHRLSQSFLIRKEDVVGKTPTSKIIQPAHPLYRSDFKFPTLIKKGDIVTIIYRSPGLLLTNQAQAQQDGAKGDMLRFIPLNSKKEIQAKVIGPHQAEVRPLDSLSE